MTTGYAQVYKCSVNGRTVFSDAPCQTGSTGILIQGKKILSKYTKNVCRHLKQKTENCNSKHYNANSKLTINLLDHNLCKTRHPKQASVMTSPYQNKRDDVIWRKILLIISSAERARNV